MRLLNLGTSGELTITEDLIDEIPPYAILSHTWGADASEVTFADLRYPDLARGKAGYAKIEFCARQARKEGIKYFWVDTCCIDKANHTELSEAIVSMFQWYRKAVKCYVYLSDVSSREWNRDGEISRSSLQTSRWFTRGWTLQELLAPEVVEFYSQDAKFLGTKVSLIQTIHEITGVPIVALNGACLLDFPVEERLRWAAQRETKRKEDQAYCLLGIFGVHMPLVYGEGEYAFHRLQEEIQKRFGIPAKPSPTHWLVPRSRNPFFTGRKDLLRDLEGLVRDAVNNPWAGTQCRIVISGIGGQGKSEICLQLAHRLRYTFWAVMWVDVSTRNIAKTSFLDVARRLSILSETWEDARLGISNLAHPWLLVLDNADDNTDYQDYFPDGPQGVILMTSRNEDCNQYATKDPIVLPGLEEEDALELVLRAANIPQSQREPLREDASVVTRLLQSHALALIQAGAYISRGHCTFNQYPRAYEMQRKRLLKFRPTQARSRYGDVYTTFEISADALKAAETEQTQDALHLLHLLAMCAPTSLPLSLFEATSRRVQIACNDVNDHTEDDENWHLTLWHVSRIPSFLGATSAHWNSFRLKEAIAILKSLSLISLHVHEGYDHILMHPLVHAWAGERQQRDEQHSSWVQAGCIVAFALDEETFPHRNQRWLQAHVEALVECKPTEMFATDPPPLIVRVLVRCGDALAKAGAYRKVLELTQRIFEHLGLESSQVEASWIGLYELASTSLRNDNKPRQGIELLKQIVNIRDRSLSADDAKLLRSQHLLGVAYQFNGQFKEAVALLKHVVTVQERTLAQDHPDLLWSRYALSMAYRESDQLQEAVALLEHVVEARDRELAEDHPDRLISQHELGLAYRQNGQFEKAATLLKYVMTIHDRILDESHPSRLSSQHELAVAYRQSGRLEEALTLLEHVVTIRAQTLVKDHPDQLWSQHELGAVYGQTGRLEEAAALLEHVVIVRDRTLEESHPSRLWSQYELGIVYQRSGRLEEALTLLEHVATIRDRTLEESHPSRLWSQHWLAVAYRQSGRLEEALTLLRHVVTMRDRELSEDHPDRVLSQHELDRTERESGQLREL